MKIKRISFRDCYIFIVIIYTFYISGSIYNFVFYDLNYMIKCIWIFLAGLGIPWLKKEDYKKITILFMIIILIGCWVLLGYNPSVSTYIKVALRFLFAYIFYLYLCRCNINILERIFHVIIVFAIVYLAAWLMFDLGSWSKYGNPIKVSIEISEGNYRNWTYTNFFNIYFRWHNLRRVFGLYYNASNGFFWEPGMYQIWLNFGLWYELFRRKKSGLCAIVLILAVISTASNMGMIILLLILAGYIYSKASGKTKLFTFLPLMAGVIVSIAYVYIDKSRYGNSGSITVRFNDILSLLEVIKAHPIFGMGMEIINTGFNGILKYSVDFGIMGTIWMVSSIYLIAKGQKKYDIVSTSVLIGWYLLSLFNEGINYFSILFLVLMALIGEKNK